MNSINNAYFQNGFTLINVRKIFETLSEDTCFEVETFKDLQNIKPLRVIRGFKQKDAARIRNELSDECIFNYMKMSCQSARTNYVYICLYELRI